MRVFGIIPQKSCKHVLMTINCKLGSSKLDRAVLSLKQHKVVKDNHAIAIRCILIHIITYMLQVARGR